MTGYARLWAAADSLREVVNYIEEVEFEFLAALVAAANDAERVEGDG